MKIPSAVGSVEAHIRLSHNGCLCQFITSQISKLCELQKIQVFIVTVTHHVLELVVWCCCSRENGMLLCDETLNSDSGFNWRPM